jgi:hypothetical protein
MALYLPMLMDKVTTVEAPMLPGRININEAPKEILAGLPGMTDEIIEKLIESRASQSDTENRLHPWSQGAEMSCGFKVSGTLNRRLDFRVPRRSLMGLGPYL